MNWSSAFISDRRQISPCSMVNILLKLCPPSLAPKLRNRCKYKQLCICFLSWGELCRVNILKVHQQSSKYAQCYVSFHSSSILWRFGHGRLQNLKTSEDTFRDAFKTLLTTAGYCRILLHVLGHVLTGMFSFFGFRFQFWNQVVTMSSLSWSLLSAVMRTHYYTRKINTEIRTKLSTG